MTRSGKEKIAYKYAKTSGLEVFVVVYCGLFIVYYRGFTLLNALWATPSSSARGGGYLTGSTLGLGIPKSMTLDLGFW